MASLAVRSNQNVMARLVNLPLVISTFGLVSLVYCNTKDKHPRLRSLCEVAEVGMTTMTSVAITSVMPFINRLEPQISAANKLACRGLDGIEKTCLVFCQPSVQVVASVKDVLTGARNMGAMGTVSCTLKGVLEKTRGALLGSVEVTKTTVVHRYSTLQNSRVAMLTSITANSALNSFERLVDLRLPLTKEEQEMIVKTLKGPEVTIDNPGFYERLGSVCTKLRRRGYRQAIAKRQGSTIRHTESHMLATAHGFFDWLQAACLSLGSRLQDLSWNIQSQALSMVASASEVCNNFREVSTLRDLGSNVLGSGKTKLANIMAHLVNILHLRWLFRQRVPVPHGTHFNRLVKSRPLARKSAITKS